KGMASHRAMLALSAAMFLLELGCLGGQRSPFSLAEIGAIVQSPSATSYFTEAIRSADIPNWLQKYHLLLPSFHGHALTKPPGPQGFYKIMLALFENVDAAAAVGGLLIGALATASLPATFYLAKALGSSDKGAFAAASLLALSPGLVLFFPEFD